MDMEFQNRQVSEKLPVTLLFKDGDWQEAGFQPEKGGQDRGQGEADTVGSSSYPSCLEEHAKGKEGFEEEEPLESKWNQEGSV